MSAKVSNVCIVVALFPNAMGFPKPNLMCKKNNCCGKYDYHRESLSNVLPLLLEDTSE